jgi:hypothetical protein
MKKEILLFYNKNTNKIIGFHHPTLFVVSDIKDAYTYNHIVVDVNVFLRLFTKYYQHEDKNISKIKLKYFNNLEVNDVRYKYVDYDIINRKMKLNKLKEIIDD